MRQVSMDAHIEYLLSFLEDELRDLSDIRIHPVAPTGTQRAADLPQDYDPEENTIHLARGVRVRADSREFFFPVAWIKDGDFDQIKNQAREVRKYWEDRGPIPEA